MPQLLESDPDDAVLVQTAPTAPQAAEHREAESPAASRAHLVRYESLAESVLVLLVLAVLQRAIGFVRGVLVCRWLSPDELGQWDLAFSFLTLAAPLAVLGLPGSFGRYVEYFRHRGQLATLIRRTAIACSLLTLAAAFAIAAAAPLVSQLVFGRSDQQSLVLALAVSLVAVVVFNYVTELLTALRMARTMSILQFANSVLFAGISIALLLFWRQEAVSMVAAYAMACAIVVAATLGIAAIRRRRRPTQSETAESVLQAKSVGIWSRLAPFAAWVWITNLLFNLFEVADRYMIVHFSTASDPLALVGDYHSSRIVPLLMVSVAAMISTITLPHLSSDWESGLKDEVSRRLNTAIKLLSLLLFAGGLTILIAAPLLFDVVFEGKYALGLAVLPWTLAYCCLLGVSTMAQTYLWCAERARLGCVALLLGVIANVVLNLALLPRFGLLGAVLATTSANVIALGVILMFNAKLGMRLDRSTILLAFLPLALSFGPWLAGAVLVAVGAAIVATNAVFLSAEKEQLLSLSRKNRFWSASHT
jgi:polysaccharide transporter, PST family